MIRHLFACLCVYILNNTLTSLDMKPYRKGGWKRRFLFDRGDVFSQKKTNITIENQPWMSRCTLPETNIAPESRPLEKENSYWKPPFSGATLVSGSVSPSKRWFSSNCRLLPTFVEWAIDVTHGAGRENDAFPLGRPGGSRELPSSSLPSLKLTAKAPENQSQWLEDAISFWYGLFSGVWSVSEGYIIFSHISRHGVGGKTGVTSEKPLIF